MPTYSKEALRELAGIISDFMAIGDPYGYALAAARAILDAGYQKEAAK